MGYIDPLGRFIRNPDVDSMDYLSSSNRKTYSKPLQFITQLVRNEQDEIVNFIFFLYHLYLIFFVGN